MIVFGCRSCIDSSRYGKRIRQKEKQLSQKAKENVIERMNQSRLTPEALQERQKALFRYALQTALRAYNAKNPGCPNEHMATLDESEEQMVLDMLEGGAERKVSESTSTEAILLQRMAAYE